MRAARELERGERGRRTLSTLTRLEPPSSEGIPQRLPKIHSCRRRTRRARAQLELHGDEPRARHLSSEGRLEAGGGGVRGGARADRRDRPRGACAGEPTLGKGSEPPVAHHTARLVKRPAGTESRLDRCTTPRQEGLARCQATLLAPLSHEGRLHLALLLLRTTTYLEGHVAEQRGGRPEPVVTHAVVPLDGGCRHVTPRLAPRAHTHAHARANEPHLHAERRLLAHPNLAQPLHVSSGATV